jgi:hypothetical protein
MSNPAFSFDQMHIISETPRASAEWYVEMFGATIARDNRPRCAQIFVELGGMTIPDAAAAQRDHPKPISPIPTSQSQCLGHRPFRLHVSGRSTALCAELREGRQASVELKQGVGGSLLAMSPP